MLYRAADKKTDLINDIVALVRDRLPRERSGAAESFVRQYYRNVPPEDLVGVPADDLYGAALSLWMFAAHRPDAASKVRAYNPRYDAHGWHSRHTVVEVVNDDMPFLVDSVTAALNALGLTVHLVIHPVVRISRDADGNLTSLHDRTAPDAAVSESHMHLEVDEQGGSEALAAIEGLVERVLDDVRAAVEDFQAMRSRMSETIAGLGAGGSPLSAADQSEAVAFLHWIDDNHFNFLGYREYGFVTRGDRTELVVEPESGLGILRRTDQLLFDGMRRGFADLPSDIQAAIVDAGPMTVTKANKVSTVHRRVQLDTILVRRYQDGKATKEAAFVGLFTSSAYNTSTRTIPFLRRKVERALARADFESVGHNTKALTHILDTYPRDELYQISDDELFEIAIGILHLQERQRTALFVRRDPFERFVSCLVFLPRDRYNTVLRERIQRILEKAYGGSLKEHYAQISEGVHARIHFMIITTPGALPDVDPNDVEHQIMEAARDWSDHLQEALVDAKGDVQGLALFRRYRRGFPTSYRERTVAPAAIFDIDRVEEVVANRGIALNLYRPIEAEDHQVNFKLYHAGAPVPLSDVLPMLEHMGLRVIAENPAEVRLADVPDPIWIHEFTAEARDGCGIDLATAKEPFETAFARIWHGDMEDDGFNRLVIGASLEWREIVILRAYAKYMRQAQFAFSQTALEDTLGAHPRAARSLVRLFQAYFNLEKQGVQERLLSTIRAKLDSDLDEVSNLTEDRILRRFINLIEATLRTNFYQSTDAGGPKPYLSLKLNSQAIEDLPLPRPWREIFVYSPRVEAVHLRGGRVARGGIRWSDRREDFRTEVLGLMKAQMVKNGVIVPVGSKGGFVVKRPPKAGDRQALIAEGIDCYKTMMRGLLDITDNMSGSDVVPPADTVRRDEDDPYLVVAADKGTATFSDIANGISQDFGFWLDDAFASGGSAGYDHKKMGITARGAWESVKRHFRETGLDTQAETFTVIGVGDMSGDVFGNGMLLSEHIRLVGAFNHLHIFVDPDPDPVTGFAERQRLFDLGRGSWDQYDRSKLSAGGDVFSRQAKSLNPSRQVRDRLGLTPGPITPTGLIVALLKAQIDLLWFGGIGTYIKATDEAHGDVGDKSNDGLRVNGRDIRARVIGEGANLALTQLGRIEVARAGCRLNTDFIDNSAGVDCSDHEVNIKILLGSVVADGDMTTKQRNALLEEMTDEVAALVLRDNYLQTQALSLATADAAELLDQQSRFMRALEKVNKLDRAIEYLPNDEELTERLGRREGLTRPEQAVVFSYGKIVLYETLLANNLPDEPALDHDLHVYFPSAARDRFPDVIARHPLRREIIATSITNSMVNRLGPTFVAEMSDKTGMGAADVARAYLIVRDSFDLRDLWGEIEALDNKVATDVQIHMLGQISKLVDRGTSWVLRYCAEDLEVGRQIAHLKPGVDLMVGDADSILYADARDVLAARSDKLVEQGVPDGLARRVAVLNVVAAGFDLIRISDLIGISAAAIAPVYFELGRRLGIAWLRDSALKMPASSHWQKQAVAAIVDDLYALQSDLSVRVLQVADREQACGVAADEWIERRRQPVERIEQLIAELRAMDHVDLSMLAVANRRLRGLMAG